MQTIKLTNTLTRKKETFTPIVPGEVAMYNCGPTVYKYAHAGNMRAYIFVDTLVRVLRFLGYKVTNVMNITDVGHLLSDADEGEDKMAKSAREQNKTPLEIAEFYTAAFFADIDALNITRPSIVAPATHFIPEMIELVKTLEDKGYAYETPDGIYFSVEKFPSYGKLSGAVLEQQKGGARVAVAAEKHHPADFALWKKAEPNHIMQWQSPWGMGFPGWHIECSAIGKKFFGDLFDIHTGGVDHIPIHHENEIAQSEAATGKKCVNYWLHNEFVLFDGGKMSKSLGNGYTISELAAMGYSAMDFKYFCHNVVYRQKLNFTFEALAAAKTAYKNLIALLVAHKNGAAEISPDALTQFEARFTAAICDDLNLPLALGEMWTMLKTSEKSRAIYDLAVKFDAVFGLKLAEAVKTAEIAANAAKAQTEENLPEQVRLLLAERKVAREQKDFKKSDELRDKLAVIGYTVRDTKAGQEVTKG